MELIITMVMMRDKDEDKDNGKVETKGGIRGVTMALTATKTTLTVPTAISSPPVRVPVTDTPSQIPPRPFNSPSQILPRRPVKLSLVTVRTIK